MGSAGAGTEVRFVFFVPLGAPAGRYAFRAASDFPAHGLAAPAHTTGVTLSDHASCNRQGYPALMITDTAFLRYSYYHTAEDKADRLDYKSMARVVTGLSKTIIKLAGAAQGWA